MDEIKPSSRKYPYIDFRPEHEIGNEVLTVEGLSKTIDGEKVLDNISFIVGHDDKIAFVGGNEFAKTVLFKILTGEMEPDEGTYKWGVTTSQSYFPKDNTEIFDTDLAIVDWLTQFSEIKDATYVRGFLGRMLFAGEDGVKKVKVLSGGERTRLAMIKLLLEPVNLLILDEPVSGVDQNGLESFYQTVDELKRTNHMAILLVSHDLDVVRRYADRVALMQGTIVRQGDPETVFDSEEFAQVFYTRGGHV